MKQLLSLFLLITILINISCEKEKDLKASNEFVGIWQFDNVLDDFLGNKNVGTANFYYENFDGLILELTDSYKYEIRREEPYFIVSSGHYTIIGDKIYIAKTAESLFEKSEFLEIKEHSEPNLLVNHVVDIEINGEDAIIFIANISFSRRV